MLNKDFDVEYNNFLKYRCPTGDSNELKREGCYSEFGKSEIELRGEKCRECWREYIEQKEPCYNGQPELKPIKTVHVKIGEMIYLKLSEEK